MRMANSQRDLQVAASTCVSQVGADAPELLGDAGLMGAQRLEESPQAVVTSDVAATAQDAE